MKQLTYFILLIILSLSLQAQDQQNGRGQSINLGYYGLLPRGGWGGFAGYEYALAQNKGFTILTTAQFSFSIQDDFSLLMLGPGIGWRYQARWGLMVENQFGIRYAYRQFGFSRFEQDRQGNIIDTGEKGTSSVVPNLSLGLGYALPESTGLPLTFLLRPNIGLFIPNGHVLFAFAPGIETGLIWKLGQKSNTP